MLCSKGVLKGSKWCNMRHLSANQVVNIYQGAKCLNSNMNQLLTCLAVGKNNKCTKDGIAYQYYVRPKWPVAYVITDFPCIKVEKRRQ